MKTNLYSMLGATATAVAFTSLMTSASAQSTFTPTGSGTYDWSDTATWDPAAVPNGVGVDVIKDAGTSSNVLDQDVNGGVTVGSISLIGDTANTWRIDPTQGITFDAGVSSPAEITLNSNNTGSRMQFSSGAITLADDIAISNLSYTNSSTAGSMLFQSTIGGAGNVTFSNVSNTMNAGHIRMEANNTFTGNVAVTSGVVSFTLDNSFGNSANAITLGSTGGGGASILSNRANSTAVTLANNITVAAGSGGTLTLGAAPTNSTGSTTTTYSGTIELNDNLTTSNENTDAGAGVSELVFSNTISGAHAVSVTGSDLTRFTGVNTYTGDTTIAAESVFELSSTGELLFNLDGGDTNQILGTGEALFDGLFRIDATDANTIGSWLLVDVAALDETFGSEFGLALLGGGTFNNDGGGMYSSGDWTFDTNTGMLSAIPEPSTWAIFIIAGLLPLFLRRRVK